MQLNQQVALDESQTKALGQDIARAILKCGTGSLLFLSGDLGSGKTVLARAIIQYLANDPEFEVPSPTYTICHVHELDHSLAHYDLYRLCTPDELEELGWDEQLEHGNVIMEWPEKCFDYLPDGAVQISISQNEGDTRYFDIKGEGQFFATVDRALLISDFLHKTDLDIRSRTPLSADASARSYELLSTFSGEYYLMDSPEMPDGAPIRGGKPYSKVAHLCESVHGFVGVADLLRKANANAPQIPYADLENGILIIEDLGNGLIIDEGRKPISERYKVSMEFLAELHSQKIEPSVSLKNGSIYEVPQYDENAMLIEAELLLDWYAPEFSQIEMSEAKKSEFIEIWKSLFSTVNNFEKSLVIRDFHSPNIIWVGHQRGTKRIGVIDFQDAVMGPAAYDVASLAQDARVDVSQELEAELIEHYIWHRKERSKSFDENEFRASYAIMAAQRATKILGIFIRLNNRDGKPDYLKHLPRMRDYLKRSLAHEILMPYRNWLKSVIKL